MSTLRNWEGSKRPDDSGDIACAGDDENNISNERRKAHGARRKMRLAPPCKTKESKSQENPEGACAKQTKEVIHTTIYRLSALQDSMPSVGATVNCGGVCVGCIPLREFKKNNRPDI